MKIFAKWDGPHLWGHSGRKGLLVMDDLETFKSIDPVSGISGNAPKIEWVKIDPLWSEAFDKIEDGLEPTWRSCSCGAQAVMGDNWNGHTQLCESILLTSPFAPKNNDGREYCFNCEEPTVAAGGGAYLICKNKECEWLGK